MWGIVLIYFKVFGVVLVLEIFSYWVVWLFVLFVVLIYFGCCWCSVVGVVYILCKFWLLLVIVLFVGGNWLIFIWLINVNYMLDVSLGYYINLLFNVLFGMLFFGECLCKL